MQSVDPLGAGVVEARGLEENLDSLLGGDPLSTPQGALGLVVGVGGNVGDSPSDQGTGPSFGRLVTGLSVFGIVVCAFRRGSSCLGSDCYNIDTVAIILRPHLNLVVGGEDQVLSQCGAG